MGRVRLFAAVMMAIALSEPGLAQLQPADRIRILTPDGGTVTGDVLEVASDSLHVNVAGRSAWVRQADIAYLERRTVAYILAVWIATFSPIPLLGSPDVVRSSAASATLVLIVSGLPGRTTLALSAAMALSAIPAGSLPPHPGTLGALEFVLGATWPRDWSDVTVTAGLFLLGGGWAATSVRGGTRPIAI